MNVGDRVVVNKSYDKTDYGRLAGRVGTVTRIDDLPYPVQVTFPGDTFPDQFDYEELDLYTLEPPC